MRRKKFVGYFLTSMLIALLLSCTTGNYMTLKSGEKVVVLGIVQTTFTVTGAFRYRSVINNQAYINLLAEAKKEYSGEIDIRDITWVIGEGSTTDNNYSYTAMGKVIRKEPNN